MNRAMIDLETLGTPEGVPPGMLVEVTEVGMVVFDEGFAPLSQYRASIRPDNGVCNPATAEFWMEQAAKNGELPEWAVHRQLYREAVRKNKPVPEFVPELAVVLLDVRGILNEFKVAEIWCKGKDFDLRILQDHMGAMRLSCPWAYGSGLRGRDLREVIRWESLKQDYSLVSHNALEDCLLQMDQLRACEAMRDRRGAA
jgi:hypothetical protein